MKGTFTYISSSTCVHFFMRLFTKFYYARFRAKLYFISPNRWCVCMEHEDFEKLCVIAFRIVAATHKEDCTCQCAFCDICHTLNYLSISWLAFLTSKLRFEFSFVFVLVFIVHSFWITFQVPLLHERERRNAFSLLKE